MGKRLKYNYYDPDFKATAVALSQLPGVLAVHVAEALDIHPVMLYRWKKQLRDGVIVADKKNITIDPELQAELKRLRKLERDHNLLKQEHELLKKTIQYSLEQKAKHSSS